jgi:hypothetical protein
MLLRSFVRPLGYCSFSFPFPLVECFVGECAGEWDWELEGEGEREVGCGSSSELSTPHLVRRSVYDSRVSEVSCVCARGSRSPSGGREEVGREMRNERDLPA